MTMDSNNDDDAWINIDETTVGEFIDQFLEYCHEKGMTSVTFPVEMDNDEEILLQLSIQGVLKEGAEKTTLFDIIDSLPEGNVH